MITYPMTMTVKSLSAKTRGTPAAMTSEPAICTSTSSRYGTSSVSYAEANQVKFIHAHQMAKNVIR
jgi:hypothetical protein